MFGGVTAHTELEFNQKLTLFQEKKKIFGGPVKCGPKTLKKKKKKQDFKITFWVVTPAPPGFWIRPKLRVLKFSKFSKAPIEFSKKFKVLLHFHWPIFGPFGSRMLANLSKCLNRNRMSADWPLECLQTLVNAYTGTGSQLIFTVSCFFFWFCKLHLSILAKS